jgi:RimJ/RimL family protein N-acetyltransferase
MNTMITEENFVDFKCPYCDQPVSFPHDSVGLVEECPNCMESLIVPEAGAELGRKIPLPITTNRLILRRFAAGDWQGVMELVADEEFFGHTQGLPWDSEEQVIHWLESDSHVRLTTPDQVFYLALTLREDGKLIGYAGLRFTGRLQATLNLNLHRSHQHQGLALEAVDALLGFCFDGINLHRVTAGCDGRNLAACRLFENVGMRREGEFVKALPTPEGGWANSVWYAALEEEYLDAGANPPAASA